MKRFFLVGVLALVVVVVGGFFAAREVAQSSNTPGMSLLASAAPGGATLSDESPSFSVGRGGPSGLSPADIFNLGPAVSIPCGGLGLALTGDCQVVAEDNVDALSYGRDFTRLARQGKWLFFSVAPGSTGLGGTAVSGEAACSPPEAAADEFASAANGTNSQYYDGDGAACDGNAGGPIGLKEKPASDDLDALDEFPGPQIAYGGDGGPGMVWFSLDPTSPSLGAIGPAPPASAGDILLAKANAGVAPVRWATAASLGLQANDDIDALCIKAGASPTEQYRPGTDLVWFSLAPGSPTLGANGWSAADILRAAPLGVFRTAAQLGLNASDNLDALKCLIEPPPPGTPTPTPTPGTPTPTNTPGTPTATPTCGNDIVEPPEECEPPGVPAAPGQCTDTWWCEGGVYCRLWYAPWCTNQCKCLYDYGLIVRSCSIEECGAECETDADCPPDRPICNGPPYCSCGGIIGGIAELPPLAGTSAEEAGASAGGSGWSAGGYAAVAGGLAAAVVVLSAGAWYARRRLIR
jgi:hypothetical protein